MNRHPRSSRHLKRTRLTEEKGQAKQKTDPGGNRTNLESRTFKDPLIHILRLENIIAIKPGPMSCKSMLLKDKKKVWRIKIIIVKNCILKAWSIELKMSSRMWNLKNLYILKRWALYGPSWTLERVNRKWEGGSGNTQRQQQRISQRWRKTESLHWKDRPDTQHNGWEHTCT